MFNNDNIMSLFFSFFKTFFEAENVVRLPQIRYASCKESRLVGALFISFFKLSKITLTRKK